MRLPPPATSVSRGAHRLVRTAPELPERSVEPQACIAQTPFCVNGQKEYRCCDQGQCQTVWVPCATEIPV